MRARLIFGMPFTSKRTHTRPPKEVLSFFGEMTRQGKERIVQLSFSSDSTLFGCLAADKMLELFRVHTVEEVRYRQKKRIKRSLAKKQPSGKAGTQEGKEEC